MMSYILLFALIAMIVYYTYSAYKTIKAFIEKKREAKNKSSQINNVAHNVSDATDEQSHGE